MKPGYIQKLESTQGFFSELNLLSVSGDLIKFFDQKKLKRVYENSNFVDKERIEWYNVIYLTNHPFYLNVHLDLENKHKLTIYYQPEQLNELIIFIRIMLKQLENAGTDNSRT